MIMKTRGTLNLANHATKLLMDSCCVASVAKQKAIHDSTGIEDLSGIALPVVTYAASRLVTIQLFNGTE